MKNKHVTRLIALVTSMSCLALTGCSSFVGEDVASYPLDSMLTKQEVVDYYAKALEYDAIVSKNITVHETTYETKDIEGEKAERLKQLTEQAETLLGQDSFEINEANLKIMSEDTFNYIKGVIDNYVLTDGKLLSIKGALGYYFVDVDYTISAKTPGQFNQLTSLIGLNGAFYQHYDDSYSLDTAYLSTVVDDLNEYYYENNIMKCASFDSGTKVFQVVDGIAPIVKKQPLNENISNLPTSSDTLESTDLGTDVDTVDSELNDTLDTEDTENIEGVEDEIMNLPGDSTEDAEVSDIEATNLDDITVEDEELTSDIVEDGTAQNDIIQDDIMLIDETDTTITAQTAITSDKSVNSVVASERKIQFDTSEINSVVGSSLRQAAKMPNLTTVYNIPSAEGNISGYGIYSAGSGGLRIFGFDRSKISGHITLRYVFKDASNGSGEILGTNIYCTEEEITNGINVASNNVLIPDFLMSQFEQTIERADRVQMNCDLSGMMSGHIYEDMGFAVLRGYKEQYTGINKCMSTVRQVIARDTTNNAYLLEIETTYIEGAKDVDCYGTYRDKYYIVIQQQGDEFKIVDQVRASRDVVSEPPINPDSTTQKRLVALNLSGEVPEDSKEQIKGLMSDLYTAGTNRLLRGPKDITVNGETVTLEKGIYDCFQNDTSILSEEDLEYANSKLRNALIKHGTDVSSIYSGTVTEWIGGYENQAEFTAEELITYAGTGEGHYMQVYYLVSCLNDVWVIDERTVLDEYDITEQTELNNIKERVGQN